MRMPTFLVFLSFFVVQLFAQDATTDHSRRLIRIDDFSRFQEVGEPEVSPDGQWVLYTVSSVDAAAEKRQSNLWIVKWDGSEKIQLTSSAENDSAPKWSPDGKYISFLSARPGPAKGNQVWVLDRRGGEAHQFTDSKERISAYVWSPDSKRLAIVVREGADLEAESTGRGGRPTTPAQAPDKPWVIDRYHFKQDIQGYLSGNPHTHISLYEIATKKTEPLTGDPAHDEEGPVWSPDGTKIAFISTREPDPDRVRNTDVFVADAKPGSSPRQLTTFPGPETGRLAWSPDGLTFAYLEGTGEPKYAFHSLNRLGVVNIQTGIAHLLTEKLDRGISAPEFSSDGQRISFLVADDRTVYLGSIPVNGGEVEHLLSGPRVVQSISRAAGHAAVLMSTDSETSQIYALEGTDLRKLTNNNDDLLSELQLGKTEDISFKSKDGTEVHGLLTTPPDYTAGKRYPTLVRIHGGPTAQDAHSFQFERQLFAANGYVVLSVNYRGSAGRGESYSRAIYQDWGHKDVEDVLASTDYAIARGIADPERLGIGG